MVLHKLAWKGENCHGRNVKLTLKKTKTGIVETLNREIGSAGLCNWHTYIDMKLAVRRKVELALQKPKIVMAVEKRKIDTAELCNWH